MELKDMCINKTRGTRCSKLILKFCSGDKCTFMKTAQQQEESCKYSHERLGTLSRETQLYISDKYYGGAMPWKKERL